MRLARPVCLLFSLAFASTALAQTIERSLSVSGAPTIVVRNTDGRTSIASHSSARVEVRATKEVRRARDEAHARELADAVDVRIDQAGDRVRVETIYPKWSWRRWDDASVQVHIDILSPRASDVDVASDDGDVTVESVDGDVKAVVEDGDLRIADCSGRLDVTAEDGDVKLVGVRGELLAVLEDGDLDVDGTLTLLKAETEDGAIDVRLLPDSKMAADWSVRAEDGRIRLALPEGFAADLNVRADDGSIEIDQPVMIDGKFSNRELSTKLNGGGHSLRVRSHDGSVRITES